jgi:hypothetical protein
LFLLCLCGLGLEFGLGFVQQTLGQLSSLATRSMIAQCVGGVQSIAQCATCEKL